MWFLLTVGEPLSFPGCSERGVRRPRNHKKKIFVAKKPNKQAPNQKVKPRGFGKQAKPPSDIIPRVFTVFRVIENFSGSKCPKIRDPMLMRENQRLVLPERPMAKDRGGEPRKRRADNRTELYASQSKHPEHRLQA